MNTIPITDPGAFECVACDILSEFTESFTLANGCLSREDEKHYVFSRRGIELYERYIARLRNIGEKLFPGCGPDLSLRGWNVCDDIDWDD